MTYHEYAANLSIWFWTAMADHLWQSTLFLLLAFVVVSILGKAAAKSRYTLWLIASAKFALPLALFAALGKWLNLESLLPSTEVSESPVPIVGSLMNIFASDVVTTQADATIQIANSHNEIFCLLTLFWLIGCSSLFIVWHKRSRGFKGTFGFGDTPTINGRAVRILKNAQIRIGLTATRVELIVSDSVLEPVVLGIWKPTVMMPRGLAQNLTDDEFESVLMHELSHIARRDNLFGVLQMALCCLLWFHPFVWLIKRKLLEERERACDEAVVTNEHNPQIYASGLLKVVHHGLHSHQSAGVANAASSNLNKRMELIMKNKIGNGNAKWPQWIVGSTFAIFVLICFASGFTSIQAGNTSDRGHLADPVGDEQREAKVQQVEMYMDGTLVHKMDLRSTEPNQSVFQYFVSMVPNDELAQTSEGKRIFCFKLIPTPNKGSVTIDVVAVLEDPNTSTQSHPFYKFKEQTVASYNLQTGESAMTSEMLRLGGTLLELKVVETVATQNPNQEIGSAVSRRSVTIRKGEELPDATYRFIGDDDSPLKITKATGQVVTSEMYTRLTGQVPFGSPSGKPVRKIYGAPVVTMVNNSGKTISGLSVSVVDPKPAGTGKSRSVSIETSSRFPVSIAPGQTYTFSLFRGNGRGVSKDYWLESTDLSNFYVRVEQVQFDDNTSWVRQ